MNSSSAVILSYYYRIFHKMLYLGKLAVLGLFLLVSADIFAVVNMSASYHWLLLSSQCIWHPTAAKAFVSALQSKLLVADCVCPAELWIFGGSAADSCCFKYTLSDDLALTVPVSHDP